MKSDVSPAPGRIAPRASAQVSSVRTTVVPTAQTRPPASRLALMAVADCALSAYGSACIAWPARSSTWTGLKVPGPTCRSSVATAAPPARTRSSSSGVKCSPPPSTSTISTALSSPNRTVRPGLSLPPGWPIASQLPSGSERTNSTSAAAPVSRLPRSLAGMTRDTLSTSTSSGATSSTMSRNCACRMAPVARSSTSRRLVYLLEGAGILAHRRGDGREPDGPALELLDDRLQDPAVHVVEPELVHVQAFQRLTRHLSGDLPAGADLSVVAHPLEEPVGDARVPRLRRAISAMPAASAGTARIPADRTRIWARSSGG